MIGIKSYGAYLPINRLSRDIMGKAWQLLALPGERTVANADEDSITMAVEAGLDCLTGIDPKSVDGIFFATTTSPYKEKQCATVIANALDTRRDILTADFTNTLRAGTTALRAAVDAINGGSAKNILVVASDCRIAEPETMFEQLYGDGASALLISNEDVAANIEGIYSIADEFVGPWRTEQDNYVKFFEVKLETEYGYAKNMFEALKGLIDKYSIDVKGITKIILYTPDPRASTGVAAKIGLGFDKIQDPLFFQVGNAGVPLCLMMLVQALEDAKSGNKFILGSYGEGSDAFYITVTDLIQNIKNRRGIKVNLNSRKSLSSYGQYMKFRKLIDRERYVPKSSPVTYWRDRKIILNLYGMKCKSCGQVQYPIQRVCINCHAKDNREEVKLAKTGKVFTYTLDHLSGGDYLETPIPRIAVDLDDGARIFLEMTDCEPKDVKVDMQVELTFRKAHDGAGFHNYYWKCRPVRK